MYKKTLPPIFFTASTGQKRENKDFFRGEIYYDSKKSEPQIRAISSKGEYCEGKIERFSASRGGAYGYVKIGDHDFANVFAEYTHCIPFYKRNTHKHSVRFYPSLHKQSKDPISSYTVSNIIVPPEEKET